MKLIEYFKGWSINQYIRLIIAVFIGIYAIDTKQYGLLIASGWFGFLAFSNISCCGMGGCNTSTPKKTSNKQDENPTINYEEIK